MDSVWTPVFINDIEHLHLLFGALSRCPYIPTNSQRAVERIKNFFHPPVLKFAQMYGHPWTELSMPL